MSLQAAWVKSVVTIRAGGLAIKNVIKSDINYGGFIKFISFINFVEIVIQLYIRVSLVLSQSPTQAGREKLYITLDSTVFAALQS